VVKGKDQYKLNKKEMHFMSYTVDGIINKNKVNTKNFTSLEDAYNYLDNLLDKTNAQVEDVVSKDSTIEYYCTDYTRLFLTANLF
jgi:hypothetical protein